MQGGGCVAGRARPSGQSVQGASARFFLRSGQTMQIVQVPCALSRFMLVSSSKRCPASRSPFALSGLVGGLVYDHFLARYYRTFESLG
jgi:hypothetical protein